VDAGETPPPDSEHLARLYFRLARAGDSAGLIRILHPDVEISLKTRGGTTLRGPAEVADHLLAVSESRSMVESSAEVFRVVDAERVIVEGRLRWMDDQRILRDDPVVWALEFRDGLLLRSTPTRSVGEAQAVLAAPAASPSVPAS
jgi:ketosteroid isomerase-like protein